MKKSNRGGYDFVDNNPTNIIDPDGNDEIHFVWLYKGQTFNQDGTVSPVYVLDAYIVKDNFETLSFYVHGSDIRGNVGEGTRLGAYEPGSNILKEGTYSASEGGFVGTYKPFSVLGMDFGNRVDDAAYLGSLASAFPELLKKYKNNRAAEKQLYGVG